jgi:hypothetical protein
MRSIILVNGILPDLIADAMSCWRRYLRQRPDLVFKGSTRRISFPRIGAP